MKSVARTDGASQCQAVGSNAHCQFGLSIATTELCRSGRLIRGARRPASIGVTLRMLACGTLFQSPAAPSGADFKVPDGEYGAEPQVCSRGESRALPAMSDRVNILGVGATPQDLNSAVGDA